MPSLKINIVSNFVGKIWSAAISLLLIPFYIKVLGIESYGLIGFYGTLLGSFATLDLGLSTTMNRELARGTGIKKSNRELRDLVFTLETIYWLIGIILALVIVIISPYISEHWIKSEHITSSEISKAVMLMGLVIAFQWPINIYNGGLLGLEKQLLYNIILVVMTTLKAAGIFLVFMWFKPTVYLFFLWQAGISLLQVFTMRFVLWKNLPTQNYRFNFSIEQLKAVWKFAIGMTSISVVTFFLSQIDKVILSKILPLKEYGYYMLSYTLSTAIIMLNAPICSAVFPRFSKLIAIGESPELKSKFHNASKLAAVVAFPVGLLIIFFSKEVLFLWTGNAETVSGSYSILEVLTVGSIINCIVNIPFVIVQAHGNTKFLFIQNTIAAILLFPSLLFLANRFGGLGASYVWLSLNVAYLIFSVPLIIKRYLSNGLFTWYFKDTFLPFVISLTLILVSKFLLFKLIDYRAVNKYLLATVFVIIISSSLLVHTSIRSTFLSVFRIRKRADVQHITA